MSISKKKLYKRRAYWYTCLWNNPCVSESVFWQLWSPIAYDKNKRTWEVR